MGLHGVTKWKEILRKEFPKCWHVAGGKIFDGFDIVVEDLMLRMYKYANLSPARSDLVTYWQSHLDFVYKKFPGSTHFYALFDDRGCSPKAKKPEQRKRDSQKPNITEEQLEELGDSAYLCNPASDDMAKFNSVFGKHPAVVAGKKTAFQIFLELYLGTRSMREDALTFAHYNLTRYPPPDGKTVVVDGGSVSGKRISYRHASESSCEVPIVGEADIKVLRVLKEHPDDDVWVTSSDSDSIVILLLAVTHLLGDSPDSMSRRIYLDMGHMTSDKSNVLDIVGLWRAILKRASPGGPWHGIKNPVETFCMLLVSTGTDFVFPIPGVGASTMWKTFMSKDGRELLSRSISVRSATRLVVMERRMSQFIRLTYYHVPNSPLPGHDIQRIPSHQDLSKFYDATLSERYEKRKSIYDRKMQAVREGTYKGKKPPPKPRDPKPALTESQIRVRVRTIGWNLFYWLEGHRRERDTSLDEDEHGVSRFGWSMNQEGLVVIANEVTAG